MENKLDEINGNKLNINLIESTSKVFEMCSHLYPKEDKHWGGDLDIIRTEINRLERPKVLDAGCGTGWHLVNIYSICPNICSLIGLDYSTKMLSLAQKFIRKNEQNKKIDLVKGQILNIPFKKEYFDMLLCLGNTLGNLPGRSFEESKKVRKKAIKEFERVLKPHGILIMSIYNAEKIKEENKYGKVFLLDRDLSKFETNDFVVRFYDPQKIHTGNGIPYYSHWFSGSEIRQLIENLRFKINIVEERLKRIVIVAQKI